MDKEPFRGANYYRLKQVDIDGQYTYSKVVVVYLTNDQDGPKVYPNPAIDQLNVQLPQDVEGTITLQIWDVLRRVVKEEIYPAANQSVLRIRLNDLQPGQYVLKMQGKRFRAYAPFIKASQD